MYDHTRFLHSVHIIPYFHMNGEIYQICALEKDILLHALITSNILWCLLIKMYDHSLFLHSVHKYTRFIHAYRNVVCINITGLQLVNIYHISMYKIDFATYTATK